MRMKLGCRRIGRINYTRTITLPKVWLKSIDIDVGDFVDIEVDEDGNLVLKPSRSGTDEQAIQ